MKLFEDWKEIILLRKKTEEIIKENKSVAETTKEILIASIMATIVSLVVYIVMLYNGVYSVLAMGYVDSLSVTIGIVSTILAPIYVLITAFVGIGISHLIALVFSGKAEYGEYFASWGKVEAAITGTVGVIGSIVMLIWVILVPYIMVLNMGNYMNLLIQSTLLGLAFGIIQRIIGLYYGYKITKKQQKISGFGAFTSAVLPSIILYVFSAMVILLSFTFMQYAITVI